jgi:hypothetical protein
MSEPGAKGDRVVRVEIRAGIEVVFDFLTDPQRMRAWAHDVDEVTYLSGTPDKVGSTFRQWIREGGRMNEYLGEVLAYERPTGAKVRLSAERRAIEIEYRLTERPTHTILELRSHVVERTSFVSRVVGTVLGDSQSMRPGEVHLALVKRAVEDSRDVS